MIDVPVVPPIDWYRDPELTELTSMTVSPDGRVFGHVAGWGTPHISFPGRRVTPPRSRDGYSHFMTGMMQVQDGDDVRPISVGRLIMSCPHAGMTLSSSAAQDFYADSGAVAATVCVFEDQHGIAIAGAIEPGLDELTLRRFRACGLSGDWRDVGGHLSLVGVISVGVSGFPIPRARVASGAPLALVAAGALAPPTVESFARRIDLTWLAGREQEQAPALSIDADELAEQVAAKLHLRQQTVTLADREAALVASLDDTATTVDTLWAEVDDTSTRITQMFAALDDTVEALNWVSDAGGLPEYIDRIRKHLQEKGMEESHAIATAVNAAKKMCAEGDTNLPSVQQVNAKSRAEACAAVADWEAKKARTRTS